jgi:hypothetical protein
LKIRGQLRGLGGMVRVGGGIGGGLEGDGWRVEGEEMCGVDCVDRMERVVSGR